VVITFGGMVTSTFGPGGPAASVTYLTGTAIGGAVASMILSAIGQGAAASFVRIVTTMACIGILIASVGRTLGALGISW
jgi:hypothetical protein